MTRLSVTVSGATLVRKGLENLAAEVPKISRERVYTMMVKARDRMKIYPPELPNQRYVRTFKLRGGWQVVTSGTTGYKLMNGVLYTSDVVGNAYGQGQAKIHVGRWTLMRDVLEQEVKTLPAEIDGHITMVARRSGL